MKVKHVNDIVRLLGYRDFLNLFYALGLSDEEIEKARRGNDPDVVVAEEARLVFNIAWRKTNPDNATIGAILAGLEDARNISAKQHFEELWITKGGRKGKIIVCVMIINYIIVFIRNKKMCHTPRI